MDYPSHWRMAYLIAFFAHLAAWLFISLAAPYIFNAMPDFGETQEIEWADVTEFPETMDTGSQNQDLPPGIPESGEIGNDTSEEPEEDLPEPMPPVEQVITPEDSPELVSDEAPGSEDEKDHTMVAVNEQEALEKLKQSEKNKGPQTIVLSGGGGEGGGGRKIAENARLLKPFYPAPGTVSFGGRVSVSARIGIDGKIKETKIMVTSGRPLVDAVAMSAAKRWVYKPATDSHGKPMECNAIIIIPFQRLQ